MKKFGINGKIIKNAEGMIIMAKEIERKFLVKKNWKPQTAGSLIAQGYLSTDPDRTVRIRIRGDKGYITVKGKNQGILRQEFEYEIPLADAEAMLKLCVQPIITKTRYIEEIAGGNWEIDVFAGANAGLIVAEIELPDLEANFVKPQWLGSEVSADKRFFNSNLIKNPFSQWKKC